MEPIRTLVVDDEAVARRGVRLLLEADPEMQVVGEASDGRAAAEAVRALRPDLLLLDVQMPEWSGFDCIAALEPDAVPVVVFMTAYEQYAIRAFEAQALDYLLKPFGDERFAAAVARAKDRVRQRRYGELGERIAAAVGDPSAASPPLPGSPGRYMRRILLRSAGALSFVRVEEIDWIEAADYYARLHVAGRSHLLRESLQELEAKLDPERFVRVHRSSIANLERARELRSDSRGRLVLVLRDGTRLPVSRRRRAALERALGDTL